VGAGLLAVVKKSRALIIFTSRALFDIDTALLAVVDVRRAENREVKTTAFLIGKY
jgi:hypothetical protein